jgi:hypothetical protein
MTHNHLDLALAKACANARQIRKVREAAITKAMAERREIRAQVADFSGRLAEIEKSLRGLEQQAALDKAEAAKPRKVDVFGPMKGAAP